MSINGAAENEAVSGNIWQAAAPGRMFGLMLPTSSGSGVGPVDQARAATITIG